MTDGSTKLWQKHSDAVIDDRAGTIRFVFSWRSHGKAVYSQADPHCRKPYMQRLPRAPKAVLFDMDGLMFDTEALYRDATITAARNAGFELPLLKPILKPLVCLGFQCPRTFVGPVRQGCPSGRSLEAGFGTLHADGANGFTNESRLAGNSILPRRGADPFGHRNLIGSDGRRGPSFRNRAARPVPNHCCLWRLRDGKTASRSIPTGRRAAQPVHFRMRCPGRLPKWGSLRIRRRSDDHHGAGSGSAKHQIFLVAALASWRIFTPFGT